MIIKSLKIENFRNIEKAEFDFSDNVNIFFGNNAQGKTNLCEAISVCLGKNFRKPKTGEIVPIESRESGLRLKMNFSIDEYAERLNEIEYRLSGGKTEFSINGIDIRKAKQLYSGLKYVIFIPNDLNLITGNPDLRRDFIDNTADMMNNAHTEMVANYYRALKQKNNFIASLENAALTQSQKIQYQIWNENLARLGVNVMCGRIKYFNTLCKYVNKYYSELNQNNETLTMAYNSSIMGQQPFELSEVEKMLNVYMDRLEESAQKEFYAKHTLVGVHRDDISFFINGMNARDYASQGQIRSIALSLRLAEAEMLNEKWNDRPIIILDDVLSELDGRRRNFILHQIVNSQLFITGCNKSDFEEMQGGRMWIVEKGEFTRQ